MKRGLTLVELLVLLTIIGAVLALVSLAVQAARERARHSICLRNLKQASLGIKLFADSHGVFPLGTNSYSECVEWHDFRNVEQGIYWKKRSQASFLVMILPYIEQGTLYQKVDPLFVARGSDLPGRTTDGQVISWFADLPGFMELSSSIPALYRCPADGFGAGNTANYIAGSQPVTRGRLSTDLFSFHVPMDMPPTDSSILSSSYLGCAGPHSGGIHPDPQRDKFRGIMSSGERVRLSNVTDGLSNTLLIGETLGEISGQDRVLLQLWTVGGLARGRGEWPWLIQPATGGLLGDGTNARITGFAATHPASVNFARADGSVVPISRDVQLRPWYEMCGRSDGGVANVP